MKQFRGWAVFEGEDFWHSTCSHLKQFSIELAEQNMGEPWTELSKRGYTVRRVIVSEEPKGTTP
jgi:hypothetical protein